MRQQRDRRVNELRDEVSLQVALHVERENTALLEMMREVGDHLGVEFEEIPLDELAREMDPEGLMSTVRERLEEAEEELASE